MAFLHPRVRWRPPRLRLPPAQLAARIAALCLYQLSLSVFLPVLAPDAARLGASLRTVGLVLAAYGFAQMLWRIPAGMWSDRLGRRPLTLAALAACAAAAVGMALAPSPEWLGAFRGLSGIGACAWVFLAVTFADYFEPRQAAWAFGLANALATGAVLVGMLTGGLVAGVAGYRSTFVVSLLFAALAIAATVFIRERPAPPPARGEASLITLLRSPALLAASGIAVLCQYAAYVTIYGFDPLLASSRFHAGGPALGLLSATAVLPSALASLASGPAVGRWGAAKTVAAGFVLAAIGAALAPRAPSLWVLDLTMVLVGAGLGGILAALMAVALQALPREQRGGGMGFFQAVYALGNFAGPAVAGAIGAWHGLPWLFDSTAGVSLVGALLAWLLLRERVWSAGA